MTGGGVKCWGSNFHGQLGIESTTDQHSPADVAGAEGHSRVCMLRSGWGYRQGNVGSLRRIYCGGGVEEKRARELGALGREKRHRPSAFTPIGQIAAMNNIMFGQNSISTRIYFDLLLGLTSICPRIVGCGVLPQKI